MTIKKNYIRERGDELRRPARREVNQRKEQKIKNSLRHGDVTVLDDEFFDIDNENFWNDDDE